MKKFLFLGIVFLSGSLIVGSSAHPHHQNASAHNTDGARGYFHYSNKNTTPVSYQRQYRSRVVSDRVSPYRYTPQRTSSNNGSTTSHYTHVTQKNGAQNYKPLTRYTNAERIRNARLAKLYRSDASGRSANTKQTQRLVVRGNDYRTVEFYNKPKNTIGGNYGTSVKAQNYFFNGLSGVFSESENTYRAQNSSLRFRVVEIGGEATPSNFLNRARSVNQNFERVQNLKNVERLSSDLREYQVLHGEFDKFPGLSQSFIADNGVSRNVYFTFVTINPTNNRLVQVQSVANARDINVASQTMQKVYETMTFQR